MNANDPVLGSLKRRLQSLKERYNEQPDDLNRYRLVCQEQLILRWENHQPMYD
jgi:hypothetical protein